jgi:hypothetical protein
MAVILIAGWVERQRNPLKNIWWVAPTLHEIINFE